MVFKQVSRVMKSHAKPTTTETAIIGIYLVQIMLTMNNNLSMKKERLMLGKERGKERNREHTHTFLKDTFFIPLRIHYELPKLAPKCLNPLLIISIISLIYYFPEHGQTDKKEKSSYSFMIKRKPVA